MADRPKVILGVSGGIAAYKACTLLRLLTESGHDVTVVPTASALKFVGEATWEALSGKPVSAEVFSDVPTVKHVTLGRHADLVLVAPATADLMARAVHGRADDLLTSTLLTATCPVVFAPAMHTEMWLHPATQANVKTLRERGAIVLDPRAAGSPAPTPARAGCPSPRRSSRSPSTSWLDVMHPRCATSPAAGSLYRPAAPARRSIRAIPRQPIVGQAGLRPRLRRRRPGSRGRPRRGQRNGARTTARRPHSLGRIRDRAPRHRHKLAVGADAVVMAAAPADFRPAAAADHKIKKRDDGATPTIELVENPDILAGMVQDRGAAALPVLVGFAAETGDEQGSVLEHARRKLARKGCDLLVVNDVSGGAVSARTTTAR